MYCKNCGRQLKENARFCDRCGQSVRRAPDRRGPSQQQRQMHRQPQPDSLERYKQYKKQQQKRVLEQNRRKKRNRRILAAVIAVGVFGAVISGVASYRYMIANSDPAWKNKDESMQLNATPSPTPDGTPVPSPSPSASGKSASPGPSSKAESNGEINIDSPVASKCQIYTDKSFSFKIPYPSSFEPGGVSNSKTRLSLKDPAGDGEMMISAELLSSGQSAKQLLKDYGTGLGGEIEFSRAGEDWYSIAFTRNGRYIHRKAIVVSGNCLYYDFSFQQDSAGKVEYKQYIDYIDEYLTQVQPALAKEAKKTSQ